jgi:L,D-transpeptidase ErfK/SrfK
MIDALSQRRERRSRSARCWCYRCAAAVVLVAALAAGPAAAAEYALAPGQKVVGEIGEYVVQPGDGLNDIARKFDLGYTALAAANPGVDQFSPAVGRRLIIPALYVLPDVPHRGIVVNLAQWRLYYFPPGGDRVETYPLGLGVISASTPLGATSVMWKEPNPTWYPPPSIRAERPELPPMIPPGPDNPLGDYAMHLGWKNYLIHGTNKPDGVGRNVSHGCIRMYPADVERLFNEVSVGIPVRTVRQPVTAGWSADGGLYVEAFPSRTQVEAIEIDHPAPADPADGAEAVVRTAAGSYAGSVDWDLVQRAADGRNGVPVLIADRSGIARQQTRPDYNREATSASYDRGAAGYSYGREAAGSSAVPAYGRDASYPTYGQPSSYYGDGVQAYLPHNAPPPEQWGPPPAGYGTPYGYRRFGPYPNNPW